MVSPYIAEALNTTTNSVFILIALWFIYTVISQKLERRFILTGLGFALVGVGLWLFHMTLRYQHQLLDELPMIYATCIPCWSAFSEFQLKRKSWYIGAIIFFASNLLTSIYLYLKDPTIHQTAYGLLNAIIVYKSMRLSQNAITKSLDRILLYVTVAKGIFLFGFGFLLWNIDNHYCEIARSTRRSWGMPYGFVLEGHGWWHIFTGAGIYYLLTANVFLKTFLLGTEDFYRLKTYWTMPYIVCVDFVGLKTFKQAKLLAERDAEDFKAYKVKSGGKEKFD